MALRAEADKLVGCMSWGSTRAARRPWPCSRTQTAASSARAARAAANLQTEGELEVEKILHTVIEHATDGRQVTPAAVCLGMAGVDRQDDAQIIRDVMRRLGFRANALIVNDALIALVAGAGASPGVVLISGTGSIAYGVSPHGVAARAGGWGPTLGDEGSGYWIGRRALAAVMRDSDGRGPQTDLTRARARAFLAVAAGRARRRDLPSAEGTPRRLRRSAPSSIKRGRTATRWRSTS